MNLLDANSVVSTLGLIGVLGIIFMETGLLIGLVFPGGEVVFLAGIAAIVGGEVGYWFGKKFGRPFFDRPESRFFNQKMVLKVEKYLATYGPRKALVFGRFIPFARTLINPVCGVANLDRKLFSTWNAIGAIIWTQTAMGIGYFLGDVFEENGNYFIVGIVALIVVGTSIPLALEVFKERQSKRYRPKSDN
jgi:membrane-associated protein